MPTSAKPRNKHKPRVVIKPLTIRDQWKVVGSAHGALLALENGLYEEAHQCDMVVFADMCRRIAKKGTPESVQAASLINAIFDVQRRANETGKLAVTRIEAATIRAACSMLIEFLERQKNTDIYKASIAGLRDFERHGGMPVTI
jgi:hypothetical protein